MRLLFPQRSCQSLQACVVQVTKKDSVSCPRLWYIRILVSVCHVGLHISRGYSEAIKVIKGMPQLGILKRPGLSSLESRRLLEVCQVTEVLGKMDAELGSTARGWQGGFKQVKENILYTVSPEL